MGNGKKILAFLLSAALAVTAFGCGTAKQGQPKNDSTQPAAAGQDLENPKTAAGDAEKETEADSVTSMGRYMESGFALPENAGTLARSMALLEDGGLACFDQESGLYISGDEGASWTGGKQMKELIPDRKIGYVSSSAIAPDGSVALCEIFFEDSEVAERRVTCVDAAGTRIETDGTVSEDVWISTLAFGADSRLYGADNSGKVYEIDRVNGESRLLFSGVQEPEMIGFTGKLLLALEDDGVEIYNLETGALQESDPVLDAFCREKLAGKLGSNADCVGGYLLGAGEGIVYLACREGLFRHVLGGSAMEQIIEGDYSTFGDPATGICSLLLLENGDFLLMDVGDELIRFTYDPDEPTVPEKQLRVYSLEESTRLRQAISAYQKEYSDVYVRYEVGITEGSAVTRMDALKNLNLSLMGEDGPDVLLLDGIDQTPYVQKGMLQDLGGILAGLTGEDAVFENITGAYAAEEGTFVIPSGFGLPLILGKSEDIDAVTDLKSLADLTERLSADLKDSTVTGAKTARQELTQLFLTCSPAWLKDGELNEALLEEFLVQAKRMYEADKSGITPEYAEWYGQHDGPESLGNRAVDMMVDLGKIAFGKADMMLLDCGSIANFLEKEEGYSCNLWSGQCGTGFVPVNKLAVSARTDRKEEAENFVRLMLSRNVQELTTTECFPVNRAAFDKLCEKNEQSFGGSFLGPAGKVKFGCEWPGEPTTRRLKELIGQAQQCLEGNAVLEEAVLKYGEAVLSGQITVQEGIATIKKAVALYLAEQG